MQRRCCKTCDESERSLDRSRWRIGSRLRLRVPCPPWPASWVWLIDEIGSPIEDYSLRDHGSNQPAASQRGGSDLRDSRRLLIRRFHRLGSTKKISRLPTNV